MDDPQLKLIDVPPDWAAKWAGMPEFRQNDLTPMQSVVVHFKSEADRLAFAELVGQTVTDKTKSLWYPKAEIGHYADKRFVSSVKVDPWNPIYIVSKGRYDTNITSGHLDKMGVKHFVVVEEKERERYAAKLPPCATILVLDPKYQRDYDTFDDLGDSKSNGPGAARNFAWEHAISLGAKSHWVMDDNIDGFYRLFNNLKTPAETGAIFRAMEDFVSRYENVGMAWPNYFMFASRKTVMPPFTLNTRIYSCNLIRNDIPFRWRGRYNEDTDLSIRIMQGGLCTIQFNAYLQWKLTTQTVAGGNTADFYAKEGTRPKSEMLKKMHPLITRVVEKWGRIHHHVNYRVFKDNPRLIPRPDAFKEVADNYGMSLEYLKAAI